jgi:hypothetical protein
VICRALVVLFFQMSGLVLAEEKAVIRYPYVQYVEGRVEFINKDSKSTNLTKKAILREKALLKSDEKSQVELKLSKSTLLRLYGPFELTIPVIAIEDGRVDDLLLLKGAMYYHCDGRCDHRVETPLSNLFLPPSELVFIYDPLVPLVNLKVLRGLIFFKGLENEEGLEVKSGQELSFKGELENEKPTYDVLLKGRKVARGELTKISDITADDKKFYQESAGKKKKEAQKLAEVGKVCKNPLAQFNQCVWRCPNKNNVSCDVCVRERCNANGEWSDRTEVLKSSEKCQSKRIKTFKYFVGKCDY